MKKIQVKLFDNRRNQNFWFHFCYVSKDLWEEFREVFKVNNIDTQVKEWLKQDFGIEISRIDDLSTAKDCIKSVYAKSYPDIFLSGESDRQGWTRVWLSNKMKTLLEENNG